MAFGITTDSDKQNTITRAQLIEVVKAAEASHPGALFFSLTQVTKEQTNKAPLPQFVLSGLKNGKTYFAKVSQVSGQVGFDYTAAVNRGLAKEGRDTDFEAQYTGYDKIEGSDVIFVKDGLLYLYYRPLGTAKAFSPQYACAADADAQHFKIVSKEEVSEYKSKSTSSSDIPKPEVRRISIDSIAAINIGGAEYVISDLDPVRRMVWLTSGAPKPIQED